MSATIIQLNPPLPMKTPKGDGLAHFLIDYGVEHYIYFVVFMDDSGECWTFDNRLVRMDLNLTFGRLGLTPFETVSDIRGERELAKRCPNCGVYYSGDQCACGYKSQSP